MDREKELLKQDLSKLETVEEVEKLREDAELLGHEDIVELANQKLGEIENKAKKIETTSESQISQVNEYGGSSEEIEKRTEGVDQKIEEVKTETQAKITEVQNENMDEVKTETKESIAEEQNENIEEVKNTTIKEIQETKNDNQEEFISPENESEVKFQNERQKFTTDQESSDGGMDYYVITKDEKGFQKSLIEHLTAMKEGGSMSPEEIKQAQKRGTYEQRVKDLNERSNSLKERITRAEERPTSLAEYNQRVEKLAYKNPQDLVRDYFEYIKKFVDYNKTHTYGKNFDSYPHKFDRLSGLLNAAIDNNDQNTIAKIKDLISSHSEIPWPDSMKEEVKTETQEKTAEVPNRPEVKNTGMTEAEKEESRKVYEKHQEWEKIREPLRTEFVKSQAQPDYFLFKNDKLNYQKALIKNFEARILLIKSAIQEEKEKKSPDIAYIEGEERELKGNEETIEYLKTPRLTSTPYDQKAFSDMRDKSGITSPSELVYKYKN